MMLYTKYRPKRFSGVVGQAASIGLRNAVRWSKLPHVILFSGSRGIGKTTLARVYANAVNCKSPEMGSPCGKCKACKDVDESKFIELDAGSSGGVGAIVDIKDYLSAQPLYKYRVLIIEEAHALTKKAQIPLLKLIEFPPSDTSIIILTTTNPDKLSKALQSRCQWWPLKLIDKKLILKQLMVISKKEALRISKESLELIAQESGGSMRTALSMLDSVSTFGGKITSSLIKEALSIADVEDLANDLIQGDIASVLNRSEEVCNIHSPKIALSSLAITLSSLVKMNPDNDTLRWMTGAAYLEGMSRRHPGLSEVAFVQCCLVRAVAILKRPSEQSESVGSLEMWDAFCLAVDGGVEIDLYPKVLAKEILFLIDVELRQDVIYYRHALGGEVSDKLKASFEDYVEKTYTWRQHENKTVRTGKRGKPTKKRGRKRR